MKKKSNLGVNKKSPDMVLHRTFRGTKTAPVSSATQGLAHKLRTLSVPITDIRKDNSLRNLGLEDQGHGVWRFNTNVKQTRYHRRIRIKGNKEEISSSNECDGDPLGRRLSIGGSKSLADDLGDNYVTQSEGKRTSRRVTAKVIPIVVNLSDSDDENLDVHEPPARMRDKKNSALQNDESVNKKVIRKTKNKNSDTEGETEVESFPELKSRSSRNRPQNGSPNEFDLNLKGRKASADNAMSFPFNGNEIKRSPKVLLNHLSSPLKRGIPSLKSVKGTDLKVRGGKNKALIAPKVNVETPMLGIKQYGLRSVTPSESKAIRKRGREDSTSSTSDLAPKPTKVQRLQDGKRRRNSKNSNATSSNSSKQEKNVEYSKKKPLPRKSKRNSGSKKSDEDDLDFKVSPSTTAKGKALPKLKLTRKHQSKFQIQWCEVCGVELHSLDNKLEHEFSHHEPRQLFVSIHRCHLNYSSVKLPVYVSSEDLTAIPDPQEDTSSPINSDDDSHPLLPVDNVLNEDEENAYGSYSSSDDDETEGSMADNFTQKHPMEDPNGAALGDAMVSPVATPERSTPIKSPKWLGSKDRSKRKSQVKMRLWEGPPTTRSGRVVKVTQKTKECMEQLACVRVLFSEKEAEEGGSSNTAVSEESVMEEKLVEGKLVEEESVVEEKLVEEESTGEEKLVEEESTVEEKLVEEESTAEEKLVPLVDEYVEVVGIKEKDVVESGDLVTVTDEFHKGDAFTDVDPSPAKEIKACDPSLEENGVLETEGPVLADNSTSEKEDVPLQSEEQNDEQKGKDEEACILSEDLLGDGLSQVGKIKPSEPGIEENDALGTEFHVSAGSSTDNKKDISVKVKDVGDEQNEKGDGCTLSENVASKLEEVNNSVNEDDVTESDCKTKSDLNQDITHEVESDETSEKQINSITSKTIDELQEVEVSLRLEDSVLSPSDLGEQKDGYDIAQESTISESDNSETVLQKDSADQVPVERIGFGGLLEDATEDNSKDIMLVDESNDALVGGALADNVEMQESSEAEFVSVPSDIDIDKFNMPEDQGLEDVSEGEWSDVSDKEMQQSPQYVNGHLGDVEMDEEGPASGTDNVGQDGEMDLEVTEKDMGLPDPMCTGEVVSETSEEEMKGIESTEDEIMAENVDEMVGVLSPKERVSIPEGGEPAAEVDMTEAVEDAEDGCMAEAIDTIQGEVAGESLGGVGDNVSADENASVEGGSSGVTLNLLRDGNVIENGSLPLKLTVSSGESSIPNKAVVEEVAVEVPTQSEMPVNGIELVAVVESGGEQGSDSQCGHREEPAETGGCKGESVDGLKECEFKVKNDLCETNRNIDPSKVTLECDNTLPDSI